MANFDQAMIAKRDAIGRASSVLDHVRAVYSTAKAAQADIQLYQAATDATFNTAVNTLFTSGERAELAAMLSTISTLVTDFETNHTAAISSG